MCKVRRYTACAIVKGIRYDDERIKEVVQLQEKLHVTYGRNRRKAAIGIYPFEKIKPPIRFMARKPEDIVFQPLEFPKAIDARKILSMHPAGREYGHLLEGYDVFPFFIDAKDEILSVPPIINSHNTGKIGYETKDVFIECSGFDFQVLSRCINMIVAAMSEMGGKICSMKLRYPDKTIISPDMSPEKMSLDLEYANKLLGLSLDKKQAHKLLEMMGYGIDKGSVLIPSYRADILHQSDLCEDIAIAYGYENFEAEIPNVATIGQEDAFEVFKDKVAQLLCGLELIEVNTYNLTNKETQCSKMDAKIELIELANSLSAEYDVLRAWTLPSLMEIFANNRHHDYPQKIFGIGTIFKKNAKTDTGIEENDRLSAAVCSDTAGYTEIKQIFDYLMRQLDLEYELEETEHPSFIPGRVARAKVKGKKVAYIGEISPTVLDNFHLEMPVCAFELNLSDLFGLIG